MSDAVVAPSIWNITARQWLILVTVQLTTLLYGMSITVANVVLPQIQGAMSATQDQIAWVVTFNLVATAVGTPLTGWLANRLGWRTVLFGALAGFTVSSALCGIANSLEFLIAARIGQGFFGAAIMPMGQGLLMASFPRPLHALVTMIWGIGAVFGPISGPALGSIVSEATNWQGAFLMIVPPAIVATALTWFALAGHNERRRVSFDWTGFLALACALSAAQLIIDRGQRLDWFASTEIVIEACVAAGALWIFVVHSLTTHRPFFDLRILLDRNFTVGLLVAFVMGMLSFTPMVLFPTLLHGLRGYPESLIGLLLAGRGLGNLASFLIVVQATRWNARYALAAGLFLQALSGWWMAQLDINMTTADVFWTNALQGFGFGLAFTPMSVLAFATLSRHHLAEGMSLFHLIRNFGSSLFISASVVVVIRSTAANYAILSENVSNFNRTLAWPSALGAWDPTTSIGLSQISSELERQAAMIGYINAFYLYTITAALAVPLAWLLRDVPKEKD
ncbi:MAG: DHA2 family efflux MFS transporter permease subunit [Pseudomonadota bacterium]